MNPALKRDKPLHCEGVFFDKIVGASSDELGFNRRLNPAFSSCLDPGVETGVLASLLLSIGNDRQSWAGIKILDSPVKCIFTPSFKIPDSPARFIFTRSFEPSKFVIRLQNAARATFRTVRCSAGRVHPRPQDPAEGRRGQGQAHSAVLLL